MLDVLVHRVRGRQRLLHRQEPGTDVALVGKEDVPLVSASEAAARSAVMEALYSGAETKQWVAPKKFI